MSSGWRNLPIRPIVIFSFIYCTKRAGSCLYMRTETESICGHLSPQNAVRLWTESTRHATVITEHTSCTLNVSTHLVFRRIRCKVRAAFLVFHSLLKSCHDSVQQEGRPFRNNHLHTWNTPLLTMEVQTSAFVKGCHSYISDNTVVRQSWKGRS
jgi:hypothetical protein